MEVDEGTMAHAVIGAAVEERERRLTGRSRATALVVLGLMAGVCLFLALVVGRPDPTGAPTCDGKAMTRDSACRIWSSRGGGGTFGYREMTDRREAGKQLWRIIGFGGAGLAVVLAAVAAVRLSPNRPWGEPVAAACPSCHRLTLREKQTVHSVSRGRTTHRHSGIVTLCTPLCGFGAVRRP